VIGVVQICPAEPFGKLRINSVEALFFTHSKLFSRIKSKDTRQLVLDLSFIVL
jgi:hypothetical protein